MNSQKTLELQQIAAKTQYDAETYRTMSKELEMERDVMRSLLEGERKKIQKLENEITAVKTRDVAASEQIRKLVREKALFVTKLNEANARNAKFMWFNNKDQSDCSVSHQTSGLFMKEHSALRPQQLNSKHVLTSSNFQDKLSATNDHSFGSEEASISNRHVQTSDKRDKENILHAGSKKPFLHNSQMKDDNSKSCEEEVSAVSLLDYLPQGT